jgi:integrase
MAARLEKTATPGIYRRGSRYVWSYRDDDGKQRWESARTLAEARKGKSARATDIDRGEHHEDSKVTLHAYVSEWVERYQGTGRRGFRENTRDEYRRVIGQYVLPYFPKKMRLSALTPRMVGEFMGHLCKQTTPASRTRPGDVVTLADSTVENIMAPLRACLSTAVREGVIRSNPAREITLPSRETAEDAEDDQVKAMTRAELATVLALLPDRWRTFHWFLAATGLRISEAIALQWRHLALDGSSPHVKVRRAYVRGRMGAPKSKHGRRDVPLDHALVVALREWHTASEWPGGEHLVFPAGNGNVMSPGNLRRRVLKPAAGEACVEWIGFHTFRHTCATLLFAEGRNAVQVQRWLGHHSPAFTLATYVHLLDGDVGEALAIDLSANTVQTDPTPSSDTPAEAIAGHSSQQSQDPDSTTLHTTAAAGS